MESPSRLVGNKCVWRLFDVQCQWSIFHFWIDMDQKLMVFFFKLRFCLYFFGIIICKQNSRKHRPSVKFLRRKYSYQVLIKFNINMIKEGNKKEQKTTIILPKNEEWREKDGWPLSDNSRSDGLLNLSLPLLLNRRHHSKTKTKQKEYKKKNKFRKEEKVLCSWNNPNRQLLHLHLITVISSSKKMEIRRRDGRKNKSYNMRWNQDQQV